MIGKFASFYGLLRKLFFRILKNAFIEEHGYRIQRGEIHFKDAEKIIFCIRGLYFGLVLEKVLIIRLIQ